MQKSLSSDRPDDGGHLPPQVPLNHKGEMEDDRQPGSHVQKKKKKKKERNFLILLRFLNIGW